MVDVNQRDRATGQAQAVGGAGLALGVPWVSRGEKKILSIRRARNQRKIAQAKANIPQRAARGGTKITAPTRSKYGGAGKKVSSEVPYHPKSASQREALRLKRKAGFRRVRELEAAGARIKPKLYPHQSKLWAASTAVGVPVSYMGARRAVRAREAQERIGKKLDQKDTTAAYAGGAGAGIAYQGGAMLTKPIDWRNEKKIKASPQHRATLAAHEKKYPRGTSAGDTRYREFFRNYPKKLPGGRMKRVFTHTHTGKSGGLATLGVIGAGAAGGVGVSRHRQKSAIGKRGMTETELRHRRRVQGKIGRTTSTLGLAGVGLAGAGALAAHKPGALRAIRKVPKLGKTTSQGLKDAAFYTGITSGGIGGVGGFNQAAIYSAESKRRKATTVSKSDGIESGYFGDEGHQGVVEKAWSPVNSRFDSEESRGKRASAYQGAGLVGAGAGAAYAGHQGTKLYHSAKKLKPKEVFEPGVAPPGGKYRAIKVGALKEAGKHGGKAAAGAAVAAGGVGLAHHISRKKKSSWQPYAKRDSGSVSAFGVDHLNPNGQPHETEQ
jgi:hypothetical protein